MLVVCKIELSSRGALVAGAVSRGLLGGTASLGQLKMSRTVCLPSSSPSAEVVLFPLQLPSSPWILQ